MMSAIVDHLWQSTLCVGVAWLLTLVLRNNAARVRYWVWMTASIKFLIPFSLLTMLGSQFSWPAATPIAGGESFAMTVQQIVEPLTPEIVPRSSQSQTFDFVPILLSVWILGALLLLIRWGLSWWRVISALGGAETVAIQAPIEVKSTTVMTEPGVIGVLRPVLLLPEGIASRLTPEQLQAVLAHELCHVRRRDNLTAAIHMLVEVLFWFHPLVWWIGARLVEERERACDEGVIELGNQPQAYAEGILKVCQFYMESKLKCVAGVSGANLRHRVESIMRNRLIHDLSAMKTALLASLATFALGIPVALGLFTTTSAVAQTGNGGDSFDEVTVRLSVPAELSDKEQRWLYHGNGKFSMKNLPLRDLIAYGYGVHITQIIGEPAWLDTTKFDIDGSKVNAPTGEDGNLLVRQMVRSLLAERFGFRSHNESREVSGYVLKLGEQEPEFVRLGDTPKPEWMKIGSSITPDRSGITLRSVTMAQFSGMLTSILKLPTVDQTGLTGKYNFRLDKPFDSTTLPAAVASQLGLQLQPQAVRVEVVVIDAIQYPALDQMASAEQSTN